MVQGILRREVKEIEKIHKKTLDNVPINKLNDKQIVMAAKWNFLIDCIALFYKSPRSRRNGPMFLRSKLREGEYYERNSAY